jgi:hypothetical protein
MNERIGAYTRSKPGKVDRAAGVISNVKLLGWESENGRRYPPEVGKKAVEDGLYSGVPCYLNHGDDERGFEEQLGNIINPRWQEDGVFGDVQLLMSDPMAVKVCEAAEKMADTFGMSHAALGDGHYDDETLIVDRITEILSVDIVTRPATTNGLFESRRTVGMKTIHFRKLLERVAPKLSKPRRAVVKKFLGREDMADPLATEVDAPADDTTPADALKAGFRATIDAVLDDDTLDAAGKSQKVKQLLQTHDKLTAPDEPDPAEEDDDEPADGKKPPVEEDDDDDAGKKAATEADDDDEPAAKESVKLKTRLDRMERREKIRERCEVLKFTPSKELVEDLLDMPPAVAERAIMRESKAARRPKSASLQEGRDDGDGGELPKGTKAFVERVFS